MTKWQRLDSYRPPEPATTQQLLGKMARLLARWDRAPDSVDRAELRDTARACREKLRKYAEEESGDESK